MQSAEIVKSFASVPLCVEAFARQPQFGGSSLTPTEMNLLSVLAETVDSAAGGATPPATQADLQAAVEQTAVAFGQAAHTLGDALSGLVAKLK